MAKQCDQCGKILPNDTIRYCTGCGNIVTSSRPAKRSISDGPPDWMKQLETSLTSNRSNMPLRELHIKVWEEEETVHLNLPESGVNGVGDEIDVVDGLPTNPLMVARSPQTRASSHTNSRLTDIDIDEEEDAQELPTNPLIASQPRNTSFSRISSSLAPAFGNEAMSHDQIEDIATRPHAAQPRTFSREIQKPVDQQRQATEVYSGSKNSPAMQRPMTPVPLQQSQIAPAQQPARQTPPVSMPVPPQARPKKNNTKRLIIVFGLLLILLLGGVIAWVIVTQPFAVPPITNTTINFKDTSLGITIQYPQHWVVVVKNQNGTVSFYDDNHTDQMNITVVVAGNQSMNQYISKTANSLGMTGQKAPTELSFAGATWQQFQGSVLQSGANYTATLLVTLHGDHYYTILQLAPSSTYPLEEQLIFSKMRSSFQF